MNTPGIFSLGPASDSFDFEVAAAAVQNGYVLTGLEGLTALTIQGRFIYGSGGTTVKVDIQTSLDQGTSWITIARLAFTTSTQTKVVNISGLTPLISNPYEPVALEDDAAVDGILGDRLRAVVTSTGTYAGGTVMSVRVCLR